MNAITHVSARSHFTRILFALGLVVAVVAGAVGLETVVSGESDEPPTARLVVENSPSDAINRALVRFARDGEGVPFYDSRGPTDAIQPAAPKTTKAVEPDRNDPAEMRRRIAFRYANPETVRFGQSTDANTAINVYREATRLIDNRHISPTTHSDRTYRALRSLSLAVGTAEFQSAYNVRLDESQVYRFRQSLSQLAQKPVRDGGEALNAMYSAMNLANNQLRLPPQAVVLEFVYAATESLDKYSAFLPTAPKQGAERESEERSAATGLEDHVVGIGVEIKAEEEGLLVERVLQGGPAARGGLKAGDVITSVNGRSLVGTTIDVAVDAITGPIGSQVMLKLTRDGRSTLFTLTRARIEIKSVSEFRMIDPAAKVGYVKLDKFTDKTNAEMDEALWSLYREGMQSLIIDVRGNPGGLLTTAIELSDKFLPCGDIVSTKGRTSADNSRETATFDKTWKLPLVVLVDENSASASEIFAAAIQENARGLLVGTKSYGKGTVQTHFPLSSTSGNLKLTTAYFYSPNGRKMAGEGVTPDLLVENPERFGKNDEQLKAAVQTVTGARAKELSNSAAKCGQPVTRVPTWNTFPVVNTWPLQPTRYLAG